MDPNIIFWSHAENQLSKPFANGFYRQFFRTLLITAIRQHKIHSEMVKQAFHAFGMVWNTKEAAVIYRSKFWSACDELKLWGELPMYMGTL